LNTPKKVQNYLDIFSVNYEKNGETYMSVRRTLEAKTAHCFEGALIAALAFWLHGGRPLLMDLASNNGDDHIVALYTQGGRWGAVSKTNHAVLRFRDPVYKSPRELAMSYFHEYIHLKTGEKILERFSKPIDLRKLKIGAWLKKEYRQYYKIDLSVLPETGIEMQKDWISGPHELFWLAELVDKVPHEQIYPKGNKRFLRNGDKMELKAGNLLEWKV
jgi:hypothetical protein